MRKFHIAVPIFIPILVLAILVVSLSSCNKEDISVEIELGQPIHLEKSIPITITLITNEDIPEMRISMSRSDPSIKISGDQNIWIADSVANQPITFANTIIFTREGYFNITAFAMDMRSGRMVEDTIRLRVTKAGATMNPPSVGAEEKAEQGPPSPTP